jgi:hypothetical protein
MKMKINQKAKSHVIALINSGKINITDEEIPAARASGMEEAKYCLGEKAGGYDYLVGAAGMVYRAAVEKVMERAEKQKDEEIADAAGRILEKIDRAGAKKGDGQELNMRAFSIPVDKKTGAPATLDEETRSFEIIAATEEPAQVYDWERGVINEVLLMDGAELPANNQMVMLDSHDRYSTGSVVGSMRDIRKEKDKMTGRVYFSSVAEAEGPYTKAREGHLTDFSIGYRVLEAIWIPEGKASVISGRKFTGPLQVSTRWVPREVSIVAIGADQNAKARSDINKQQVATKEEYKMDPIIRSMLEAKGLSKEATDEEAVAFLAGLDVKREEPKKIEKPAPTEDEIAKIRKEASEEVRKRYDDIEALCARSEMPEMARTLIKEDKTLDEARQAVLDEMIKRAKNPGASGAEFIADEKDKFRCAAQDSLIIRAGMKIEKPAPGADELRGHSLVELARECLIRSGKNHRGFPMEMVGRAMTTSDFPLILANLANKSLMEGYEGAQETWPLWCGIGSVADFKTAYDYALSEHSDLDEIPERAEYKYGKFTERREAYSIATYGKIFAISRQMIINDDLGAIAEMPAKRGEAAARKVGDVAYAVITANGNMGDSQAIFSNTYHSNDEETSGVLGVPNVTSLAAGILAMGTQKDMQGLRRLNIRPNFFLAPKALEGTAEVFFRSEKFDGDNAAATRVNPYAGNYFSRVYEARLDDDSATAWYLIGPKGSFIKVVFLNGVQSPFMESKAGWNVDGVEYKVRIDVGAYAKDYRTAFRNEGA